MESPPGGQGIPGVQRRVVSDQVGHDAAGLPHEQRTRRDVPARKTALPEAVVPAARGVGHVERGRTRTTHSGCRVHEGLERLQVAIET